MTNLGFNSNITKSNTNVVEKKRKREKCEKKKKLFQSVTDLEKKVKNRVEISKKWISSRKWDRIDFPLEEYSKKKKTFVNAKQKIREKIKENDYCVRQIFRKVHPTRSQPHIK